MNYFQLSKEIQKISTIGLGGLHFGVFLNKKETNELIEYSYQNGINFIDTSPIYGSGNSEQIIGECIKKNRNKFILGTKVGLRKINNQEGNFGVEVYPLIKKNIIESVEKSLKNLDTDYINILQLHTYDDETPLEETISALKELKQSGKIINFGFCNYSDGYQIDKLIKLAKEYQINFVSCQLHYNLIERRAEDTLIPSLKKNKINLLTHHSLARGILTGKYMPNQPIPPNSRAAISKRVSKWLLPEVLNFMSDFKEVADELKVSCTALVIGMLSKNKNVQGILIGARNKKQLKEILDGICLDINEKIIEKVESLIDKNKLNKYKKKMPLWFQEK